MKMIFMLLATLASSSTAFAITNVEQNLIPALSENEITTSLKYLGVNGTDRNSSNINGYGFGLKGSYYYGFAENQALGLDAGVNSTILNQGWTTIHQRGPEDLEFRYKGNFDVGASTLYVSAGFNLSPGPLKLHIYNSNDLEYNNATGSNGIPVKAGFIFPGETLNYGFIARYTYQLDGTYSREQSGVTTTADLKGGSSYGLSALIELNNFLHPNFNLEYIRKFSAKAESDSTTFTAMTSESLGLSGSMRISITDKIELIPFLNFWTFLNKNELNLNTYLETDTGVKGRFLF